MQASENSNKSLRRWRGLAIFFLILWLGTGGVFATLLLRGQTSVSQDGRRAVQLTPAERDFVLMEMRHLLEAVHAVHSAQAGGDRALAITAARGAGMQMVRDGAAVEQSLLLKLPAEMKALGISTHQQFDVLANQLESGAAPAEVAGALTELTARCVACHRAYRLE